MKKVSAVLTSTKAQMVFVSLYLLVGLGANRFTLISQAQASVNIESVEKPYTAVIMTVSSQQGDENFKKGILPMFLTVNNQTVKINHLVIQESNQVAGMQINNDVITITIPQMEKEKQVNILELQMGQLLSSRLNIVEI